MVHHLAPDHSAVSRHLAGPCHIPDASTAGDFPRHLYQRRLKTFQAVIGRVRAGLRRRMPAARRKAPTVDLDSIIKGVYGECSKSSTSLATAKGCIVRSWPCPGKQPAGNGCGSSRPLSTSRRGKRIVPDERRFTWSVPAASLSTCGPLRNACSRSSLADAGQPGTLRKSTGAAHPVCRNNRLQSSADAVTTHLVLPEPRFNPHWVRDQPNPPAAARKRARARSFWV